MRRRTRDRIVSYLPRFGKRGTGSSKAVPTVKGIGFITKLPLLPFVANLQVLPTELLCEVWNYLPLSSKVALSYASRRFRYFLLDSGLSIKTLFPDVRLSGGADGLNLEQWRYHCMMERDRPRDFIQHPASKIVCGKCQTLHCVNLFSQKQLQQDPSKRQCLGSEGKLWICPEMQLTGLEPLYQRELGDVIPCDDLYHRVHIDRNSPYTAVVLERSILSCTELSFITEADVEEALGGLEYNICPHFNTKDPSIPRLYNPVLSWADNTLDNFLYSCSAACNAPQLQQCEICNIRLGFKFRRPREANNRKVLYLHIRRLLSPSYRYTDPNMLAQLVNPSKFGSLNQQWMICNRKIDKQIPPFPEPIPRSELEQLERLDVGS